MLLKPEVPALLTVKVPPEVKLWTLKSPLVVTVPPVATVYVPPLPAAPIIILCVVESMSV
jgi:hypothetical protein